MAFIYRPAEHPMTGYSPGKNQRESKTPLYRGYLLRYKQRMFFEHNSIPHHDSDAIFYRGNITKHSLVFYKFLMFLPMPSEYPSKSIDFSYAYPSGYLDGRRNKWQLHSLWRTAGEKSNQTALWAFCFIPSPSSRHPPHCDYLS